MIVTNNLNVYYGKKQILFDISLAIKSGERALIVGPNGAGKSTLIKLLAGEISPFTGKCDESRGLRIGYFAQHQLEQLDADRSPLAHLQQLDEQASEKDLRNFLGGFAFTGDMATEPVGPLSGGEKARLVLAMLVYNRPNLLLLDEPTNHLDLEMRHALTMALQEFDGAMILVSHDRHMLRSVCDTLLLVAQGCVETFTGDLEEYADWLIERRNSESENHSPEEPQLSKKEKRRQSAEQRKSEQPLRRELKRLEQQIMKLHAQKTAVSEKLADPTIYDGGDSDLPKALSIEHSALERQLNESEEQWLLLSGKLEQT